MLMVVLPLLPLQGLLVLLHLFLTLLLIRFLLLMMIFHLLL
jgi:hypothetical protein